MPDLEPLLRYWRALDALYEAVDPTPWGAVVSDRRFPAIQEPNYARVETSRPVALAEVEADLLPALSRSGCPREHVVVFRPEEQTALLVEASTRGERLAWDLVMVHRGPVEPSPEVPVEEVLDPDDAFWLTHRESLALFDLTDPGALDQVAAIEREVLLPAGRRWFAVPGPDGVPASLAALLVLEGIAFVDVVVTFPWARRRGYATALTRRVLAEASAAGAERTYLLAEPRGRAVLLYRRLGFEPVTQLASWVGPVDRAVGGP
jgi:ribosomal protein S18 acetylase RimI-like enzyme